MSGNGQDNRMRHIKAITRMRIAACLLVIAYMRLMKSIKDIWQDLELHFYIGDSENPENEIFAVYHVKNNSNTDLAEVLKGEAVFTLDAYINADGNVIARGGDNHKGKTTGKENKEREFDFVQKMINHIVPPLRTPVKEANLENTIDVDGLYGAQTEKIVKGLITGGDVEMSATKTITLTNDLKISHHVDGTNDPKTFRKLARDYTGITDFGDNATELDHPDIGKVIDKELLMGFMGQTSDTLPINDNDIGILELYENDDWDGDGISNYIEVENSTRIDSRGNFIELLSVSPLKNDADASVYTDLINTTSRGYHGVGEMVKATATIESSARVKPNDGSQDCSSIANCSQGLRIPDSGKGYYYFRSEDIADTDNYAILATLQKVEEIGRKWAGTHREGCGYLFEKSMFWIRLSGNGRLRS